MLIGIPTVEEEYASKNSKNNTGNEKYPLQHAMATCFSGYHTTMKSSEKRDCRDDMERLLYKSRLRTEKEVFEEECSSDLEYEKTAV